MKHALVVLLLLAGCASKDDFTGDRTLDCAATNEVMVRVGLDAPGVAMERVEDRFNFRVEVSNNTSNDIVVKWVRVEQVFSDGAPYSFDNTYRKFDQLIAEGEDFTFELPSAGRAAAVSASRPMRGTGVALATSVGLASGAVYRCTFEVNRGR